MKEHRKIGIIGGDTRTLSLARVLCDSGYECALWGLDGKEIPRDAVRVRGISDAIRESAALILPLPVSRDSITLNAPCHEGESPKLENLFDMIEKDTLVVGGGASPSIKYELERRGLEYVDYLELDEFATKNAVPTSEGALALAINETPKTISSSKCAVVGYGKIGKRLSRSLAALGANVTVAARRSESLELSERAGHTPLHISRLSLLAHGYDIIFNTVPVRLFTKDFLLELDPRTLIIDLASAPYGAERSHVEAAEVKYIIAPGLPGKCAPESAGEIIGECVRSILASGGIEP